MYDAQQKCQSERISTFNKEKYRRNNLRRYKENRNEEGKTKKEIEIEVQSKLSKELKQKKFTNKQIAEKLGISESTVKRYLKN